MFYLTTPIFLSQYTMICLWTADSLSSHVSLTTGISRISWKTEVEEIEVGEVSYGLLVTSWQTRFNLISTVMFNFSETTKVWFWDLLNVFHCCTKLLFIVSSLKVSSWLVWITGQGSHSGIPTKPIKLNGNFQHVRAVEISWPFVHELLLAVHFHWNTMDQLWIVGRTPRGTAERLWYLSHQTLIVTKDLLNHSSGCPPVLDHVEKST